MHPAVCVARVWLCRDPRRPHGLSGRLMGSKYPPPRSHFSFIHPSWSRSATSSTNSKEHTALSSVCFSEVAWATQARNVERAGVLSDCGVRDGESRLSPDKIVCLLSHQVIFKLLKLLSASHVKSGSTVRFLAG